MKKIGKYTVLGLLGKGGMGRVYKAMLPVANKIVALKLLSPHPHLLHLLGYSAIEDLFIREAETLAAIHHPHVAAILDFDFDDKNRPFFVMSYHCMNLGLLIGEQYRIEAATRIMPPDRTVHYIDQILAGLDRLHHAGLLHRDIKPYNILITDADEVRIIDFGLSLLRGEVRQTPDNLMVGTPYYAAPEQEADPDGIDERADLYSVGVLLWRMLTGELPPEKGKRPAPGSLNPVLGEYWNDCLYRATAPMPEDRFSACDPMRRMLSAAYNRWRTNMEKVCRIDFDPAKSGKPAPAKTVVERRKQPVKIARASATRFFGLDPVWRPEQMTGAVF